MAKKIEENTTNQPEERKTAPQPTLKERISEVVEKYEDKDELKKGIFDLVQRIQFPDQFCPDCDDRLFLNGNTYNCLNCGFTREASVQQTASRPVSQPNTTTAPKPTGKVPEAVEKAIQMANENMSETPRSAAPGSRGAHIQKLVEKMGDSTVPATPKDTEIVKGADPNVRDVNWV